MQHQGTSCRAQEQSSCVPASGGTSRSGARSAQEILRREYGTSRNMLTPHVITRGKVTRSIAYELSSGEGIEPGTRLYGVSVVRYDEASGTTERLYDSSACFSTLDAANRHVQYLRAVDGAREDGYASGVAAGSWLLDGNSTEDAARELLRGIEDGDPAVLDLLPSSPLSGEWAGDPLAADVLASYDMDEDDKGAEDVLRAYEDAFSQGVQDEAVRSARAMLGAEDAS